MAFSFSSLLGLGGGVASNLPKQLLPDQTISRRSQFLQVLEQWWSTPALNFLWCITFNMPNLLTDANMEGWGEDIGLGDWGVDDSIGTLHKPFNSPTNISGCMFAQKVELPSEETKLDYAGIFNRGFTPTPILWFRERPVKIKVELLETNTSFTDSIIRPWTILASHYGPVARPNGQSIKSDFIVYELAKSGDYTTDLVVRKKWYFTGCFPINVAGYTKEYGPESSIITRSVDFAYTRYQVSNNLPTGDQILQRF